MRFGENNLYTLVLMTNKPYMHNSQRRETIDRKIGDNKDYKIKYKETKIKQMTR